jgi:hypothetical protein
LVQGLRKSINLEVKCLKVFGEWEIIVGQVKNLMHFISPHLKKRQLEVWKLINNFDTFNITSIPHSKNATNDTFDKTASRFAPLNSVFSIELIFRPSTPDNVTNWNDDDKLTKFLSNQGMFKDVVIDDEEHKKSLQNYRDGMDNIKCNPIPKGVITLENFFDL